MLIKLDNGMLINPNMVVAVEPRTDGAGNTTHGTMYLHGGPHRIGVTLNDIEKLQPHVFGSVVP